MIVLTMIIIVLIKFIIMNWQTVFGPQTYIFLLQFIFEITRSAIELFILTLFDLANINKNKTEGKGKSDKHCLRVFCGRGQDKAMDRSSEVKGQSSPTYNLLIIWLKRSKQIQGKRGKVREGSRAPLLLI